MTLLDTILSNLNDAQRAPVVHGDGPLMVVAGAGSGKTRVLTYRIAYLMANGVDPFNILSLTFTNKAAREMKSRIGKLVGESESKNLWMGTFHSIFARLLRYESEKLGYPNNFTIYDTQDSDRLIAGIIREMDLNKDVYKYKQIRARISSYKNNLITVRAYFNHPELMEADAASNRSKMGDIYKEYCDRCFRAGAMDFDDLLLKTNELLNRFPEVLAKYQDRFRYLLVDEYQDTNHSQYLIVRALADRYQNICVVGDDSQSIYAFRGANIQNILNFQHDFDGAKIYRLEQNYRSTKNIVEAANSVISMNKMRLEKRLWTSNEDGDKIYLQRSLTDADEGRFVAGSVFETHMHYQQPYRNFAVLYRTNAQSRSIEDAFRRRDIPYRIYGGLSFYQRKEIKDVLAYLRLVINPKDEESLRRIINFPGRGIGEATLDKLQVAAKIHGLSLFEAMEQLSIADLGINQGTKSRLDGFITLIKSLQILNESKNAFELADEVVKKTGLIKELGKEGTPEDVARVQNVEEMLNGIRDFVDGQREVEEATGNLNEYLQDIALITDLDTEKEDDDRVSLMTVHLAKGLEFPYIYIVGMEEDLFPSAMNMSTREELEEERRLFYVALTRAEKRAFLSYTESRYRWGKLVDAEPSRFLKEIDPSYLVTAIPDKPTYQFKPLVDGDIFDSGPVSKTFKSPSIPAKEQSAKLKKLASLQNSTSSMDAVNTKLEVGDKVMHERFGKGKVVSLEGSGVDKKAEIEFHNGDIKKLLLRFAKLQVL